MAITTAADLAAGQIAMVGTARYTWEHEGVMTGLCTKVTLGAGEKSYYQPKFGRVAAADLTDGVDITDAQSLTITGTTMTTDEAGLKVIITKKLANQLKEDAYAAAGRVIGNAIGKKMDVDGLALLSGLNSGVGAAGSTFSHSYLLAAITQCYGQSEPVPEPINCVLHPYLWHKLKTYLAMPGTSNMPADIQKTHLVGKWRGTEPSFGIPVFIDGNISVDTSDDSYGAVFSKDAFVYLVGWEPEQWTEEDKSLRGFEIGVVADYNFFENDGTYGRYLLFDTAAPTS